MLNSVRKKAGKEFTFSAKVITKSKATGNTTTGLVAHLGRKSYPKVRIDGTNTNSDRCFFQGPGKKQKKKTIICRDG